MPALYIGRNGQGTEVRKLHRDVANLVPSVRLVDEDEARAMHPFIAPGYVELAMLEPGGMEIDVHAVHQGYTRGLRKHGGLIKLSTKVVDAKRQSGIWLVTDSAGNRYETKVLVNASGAWVDEIAAVAGVMPIGIRPLRRTIFMIPAPLGDLPPSLPMIADLDATFYLKPERNQFLCSPADETLQPPSDARTDTLEIARALDAINDATTLNARHVRASWAGLRNFAPDRLPVVGYDPLVDDFFWFAGQGGYGIQTAPALARFGASIIRGSVLDADILDRGLDVAALSPSRW